MWVRLRWRSNSLRRRTGLIIDIGRFVLNEACRSAIAWLPERTSIAVNVSGAELGEPDYVEHVIHALAHSGLAPDRLILEVTETTLGADADTAIETLQRLRRLGIRVAIDDFGVGYSSLSRLARLPVDILKLDRSFVTELIVGGDDAAGYRGNARLVAAIASVAEAAGLTTIAEGIERRSRPSCWRVSASRTARVTCSDGPCPSRTWPPPWIS